MRKFLYVLLLLFLLLLAVGVYYYYSLVDNSKPINPVKVEQLIPAHASAVVKVDLTKYKFTVLKEMMSFAKEQDSTVHIESPLSEFAKEVFRSAGGGIALFEPVYAYKVNNDWGVLIALANPAQFDTLLHHSEEIILLNDSVAQIRNTTWELHFSDKFVNLYNQAMERETVSSEIRWDLSQFNHEQHSLLSALIKSGEGIISTTIDYHKGKWFIKGTLPSISDTTHLNVLPKRLTSSEKTYLDLFISDPNNAYLKLLAGQSVMMKELLHQLKRPTHLQYFGKKMITEKYVTYAYNDDFEMEEVVKIQQKEKELITGLYYTNNREEGSELKKNYEPFFTHFEVQDQWLVASYQPVDNSYLQSNDSLYAQIIVRDLENQIPKQLEELLGKKPLDLPFTTLELYAYKSDSSQFIHVTTTIVMKKEYQGLFDLRKLMSVE